MWVDERSSRLCGLEHGATTRRDSVEISTNTALIRVGWAEPRDVSNEVLFLASDEARYITGATLPVDARILARVVG
jgi:(+)-trans-carveol dehydrogenase/(-)-trans-carveol dehydrogenase